MLCNLCNRRITQAAKYVTCSICHCNYHRLCIPGVDKYDEFYHGDQMTDWICIVCNNAIFPYNHIEDNDKFVSCLSENWIVTLNLNLAELREKTFNPFELNCEEQRCPLWDSDPDIHYYNLICNNLSSCDYYLEDAFNEKCNKTSLSSNCFSMIHFNVRSIPKNLQAFEIFMSNLCINFTILAFSETWLTSYNNTLYNIDGYNAENVYRTNRKGGGVSLYIREHVSYTTRIDIDIFNEIMESKFVEIDKKCISADRNVIIGVIYRPPNSDVVQFTSLISGVLQKIKTENKKCFLLGDYNINLFNAEKHHPTSGFLENMFSYEYIPLINKPTRDSGHSASLIDNIYCNQIPSESTLSGLFYTDVSDHYPIFHIENKYVDEEKPHIIIKRLFSERCVSRFTDTLRRTDWSDVLNCFEPQRCYSTFFKTLNAIYEKKFSCERIQIFV